jgi:hypothetical protein
MHTELQQLIDDGLFSNPEGLGMMPTIKTEDNCVAFTDRNDCRIEGYSFSKQCILDFVFFGLVHGVISENDLSQAIESTIEKA